MPTAVAIRAGSMRRTSVLGGLALLASLTQAQESGLHGITVEPLLTVQETLTNNRDLTSTNPQSDAITQISPGIRIGARTAYLRGYLAYSLDAIEYLHDRSHSQLQNALNAALTAVTLDNHLTVDANARISQQTISAYGTQVADPTRVNENRSEVATLGIVPKLQGTLFGRVNVTAQLSADVTRSASTSAGDAASYSALLTAGATQGIFGWGVTADRHVTDYTAGRRTTEDRVFLSLTASPNPEWRLSLRGGREQNDVAVGTPQDSPTYGVGVEWHPGERTQLNAQFDHRYFGPAYSIQFTHRAARSVWSYFDTLDKSSALQLVPGGQTLFDQFFNSPVFLALAPDPVLRAQLVQLFLQGSSLDPNAPVGGFLTTSLTRQRNQSATMAWSGIRSTVMASAFRAETQQLDGVVTGGADLSHGAPVRQVGWSLVGSHRLTPTDSLGLTVSLLRTLDTPLLPGTEQRSLTGNWSGQLSRLVSGTAGLRYTRFASDVAPYNETAAYGSVTLHF